MTAPKMAPVHQDAIPDVLKTLPIWRNWRWLPDRENPDSFAKRPWKKGAEGRGFKLNGHILDTAETWTDATTRLDAQTGLGIVAGTAGLIILDLDYKSYTGPRVEANMPGALMDLSAYVGHPIAAAWYTANAVQDGCYAELSPSGQGIRIIVPGTLPEGHSTRWQFAAADLYGTCARTEEEAREMAEGIGGEVYSTRRWLTLTGNHLHGSADTASLSLAVTTRTQYICDEVIGWSSKRAGPAAESVDIDATLRSEYVAPEALIGALSVFRGEKLAPLWTGELRGDSSRLDYRLCNTLFEVLGDDPQAVNAAFLSSGRVRAKWGTVHVRGQTYGAATIASARQNWLDGGCKRFRTAPASARPAIDWPAEARERLIFGALSQARGNSAGKQSIRRILGGLFDHIDKGECHVHQGRIYVHTGGIRMMEQSMSAGSTDIKRRLAWMPGAGFIAQFSQDENGRPQVVMYASHTDCPALLEGLRPGYDVIPARPQTDRKPRAVIVAPKARAPRVQLPKSLQRAEWSMWLLMGGRRDVDTIAEMSGQSARAVRGHITDLKDMNLLTDDLQPVVSHSEYRALVADERALCWQITRERRAADTAEYKRRCAMRGTKNPSPNRLAQMAADDAAADLYANAAD